MKSIKKSENKGNTFIGLVMSAFDLKCQSDVVVSAEWQCGNCGTIEVCGVAYDWRDNGENVVFVLAA